MNNERYSPTGFGILPPVVKNLLIINALFFLATVVLGNTMNIDLTDYLGLHYFTSPHFATYQFVSYMFMHGSFSHILFNMFALWMFGSTLENLWGSKRFLIFYLICGLGAALVHMGALWYDVQQLENAFVQGLISERDFYGSGYSFIGRSHP